MAYTARSKDNPGDVGRAADQNQSVDNDTLFRASGIHVQVEPFGWIAQTDCAVGDDVITPIIIPIAINGMALIWVECAVETAGVTTTMDIMVRKNAATDMLSTVLTLDSTETNSSTAAAPVVIKTDGSEDVVTGDVIHFDIDSIHTTPAKGLIITARFG